MKPLAQLLLAEDIVQHGNFTLSSGQQSTIYFDIRKAYGNPHLLDQLILALYHTLPKDVFTVADTGYGGIPLSTGLTRYGRRQTLIREKQKEHGTRKTIEGYEPARGERIALVDDVFTTGGNLRHMKHVLEDHGSIVTSAHVILKRGETDIDIPIYHLLTPKDFE